MIHNFLGTVQKLRGKNMSTPAPVATKTKAVLKKKTAEVSVQTEDIPDTVPDSEPCDGILILDKTTKNFRRYAITNSKFSGSIYVPPDCDITKIVMSIKK